MQLLDGENALAFARSRTNSTDYVRMGRQRCLIQALLDQKSPTDLLTNFQAVAQATTDTRGHQHPARRCCRRWLSLADGPLELESVAFDPSLPDPDQSDGRFDTGDPNFELMRQVVQDAINPPPAPAPPGGADPGTEAAPTLSLPSTADAGDDEDTTSGATDEPAPTTAPVNVAATC